MLPMEGVVYLAHLLTQAGLIFFFFKLSRLGVREDVLPMGGVVYLAHLLTQVGLIFFFQAQPTCGPGSCASLGRAPGPLDP